MVDYGYYTAIYSGTLVKEKDFSFFSKKAMKIIQDNCNKKLEKSDITDDVKYVACELIDYLFVNNKTIEKNLSSVSVDGVSESYNSVDDIKRGKKDILNGLPQELTRYL